MLLTEEVIISFLIERHLFSNMSIYGVHYVDYDVYRPYEF